MLDARIPPGPIEQNWDKCRFDMKLVNPANRRKYNIIVVGCWSGGSRSRRHSWSAGLSRQMLFLS